MSALKEAARNYDQDHRLQEAFIRGALFQRESILDLLRSKNALQHMCDTPNPHLRMTPDFWAYWLEAELKKRETDVKP